MDPIVHKIKSPFECSAKTTFIPSWDCYPFEPDDKQQNINTIFVVPHKQSNLKELLISMDSSAVILSLDSMSSILEIKHYIEQINDPHILFICQSNWHQAIDEEAHTLFLSLIQALTNNHHRLQLDIVTIKALHNPYLNSITHPFDGIYIGLGQTIAKELTHWTVRVFNLDNLNKKNLDRIKYQHFKKNESSSPIHIVDDNYYYCTLSPITFKSTPTQDGFKENGTYLIIGGNSGIGSILADHLIKHYKANLILVGRSEPNAQQKERYPEQSVIFEKVDITSAASVEALFSRHPHINGIIHSALVLDDASIMTMTSSQLLDVLAPKVNGTFNLINSIRYRALDFVLFFSSIQSFIANAGQANYTAACVCKDSMSHLLNNVFLVNSKIINWGYWGQVGIVANDFYRQRMEQLEIGSIEIDEGIHIIEQFLQSNERQIAVVKGSSNALMRLGIQEQHSFPNEKLKYDTTQILSKYNPHSTNAIRNNSAMKALENYTSHRLHQTVLPDTVLPRYKQLKNAISSISYASSPDTASLLASYPEISPHIKLLEACLSNLPQILTGQVDALSILFPNGSFELVEPIYRNNPIADYYNNKVAETVVKYIHERRKLSSKPIRILEIGAGTGSTSQAVIPAVSSLNVNYFYTDLSLAFLNRAKRAFGEYDFIKYEIYNAETPYKESDYFDIVIATNVIHATRDVHNTVKNIYNLLGDGGIFILNEITKRQDFATLTFGLTEGWWLSNEAFRIANSPLLDIKAWKNVLTHCHFEGVMTHGEEGQHIILGNVGKKNQTKSNAATNHEQSNGNSENSDRIDTSTAAKAWLTELISTVMHLPKNEIEGEVPFSQYGIDSLIMLEFIQPLRAKLGYVPATVLFEYPTLNQLADHFDKEHPDKFPEAAPAQNVIEKAHIHSKDHTIHLTIKEWVTELISTVMHLPKNEIEGDAPFSQYGIDSLIMLELIQPMRAKLDYVPATVLFEYPTLNQLVAHFSEEYANKFHQTELAQNFVEKAQASSEIQNSDNKEMQQKADNELNDCIAIIGISGQFPMANDCDAMWSLLKNGANAYSNVPPERWPHQYGNRSYTQVGAFIDDVDIFDHVFFNIAPIEAEKMDPQERLFLQTAYHAIQDAGLSLESLSGKEVGCYIGVMNHSYSLLSVENNEQANPSSLFWSIANRASYAFNWRGPSFAVDSACSSSLTALHTAILGLKNNDCDIAVVGGVNLIVHPQQYEDLCQLHMLSPSGKCQPFAAGSNGFVDGEGVVCVVIKRYKDAIDHHDQIYGVIRGSAINAGGKSNGYTAPNPDAQASMIKKALERAGLNANDIGYIEAHGTGTELGDPIEVRGLTKALSNVNKQSIAMGSIKGNIGHLESAAGLAAVIKVLLQMKHKMLVPSINCDTENPYLQLSDSPVYVNKTLSAWPKTLPLRSCVSSFGAGGANAHVIIEAHENQHIKPHPVDTQYYLFPLSAHSQQSLQNQIDELRHFVESDDASLAQISYGYCCVRSPLKYRTGFVASDKASLILQLSTGLQEKYKNNKGTLPKVNHTQILEDYLRDNQQDISLANALMNAYIAGDSIPFNKLFAYRLVAKLPKYPFDKHRHWVNAKESGFHKKNSIVSHHNILSHDMAPAAFSLTKLIESTDANILQSVTWKNIITDLNNIELTTKDRQFQLKDKNSTQIYCEGIFQKEVLNDYIVKEIDHSDQSTYITGHEVYQRFNAKGYRYGRYFQAIKWAYVSPTSIRSLIEVTQDWGYKLSPAIIDAGLQTAILYNRPHALNESEIMVPYFIEKVMIYRLPGNEPIYCTCYPAGQRIGSNSSYDIEFSDVHGRILITLQGVISVKTSIDKLLNKIVNETTNTNVNVYQLN